MEKKKSVKSLLSVSTLTINDAKVQLTMQYRVPRDIAALLNSRIYNGKYETPKSAKVPNQGFRFIHVPFMESNRRKYVNDNEVDYVIRLVRQHVNQGNKESIMVLTPVRLVVNGHA
jgi:superfamily I DNA and/or RNA helicase